MSDFDDVGDFHERFGLPRVSPTCDICRVEHHAVRSDQRPGPRDLPDDVLEFRAQFLWEELLEFGKAREAGDMGEMADALVDLVYVAMGTAHLLGLPWRELWDDVHRANMRKVRAASDASDSRRGSSWDVVKPEGWRGPDGWAILERYGWARP